MKPVEFNNRVEAILSYILGYAQKELKLKDNEIKNVKHSEFITKVHEGWKIAQNLILETELQIEAELEEVKKNRDKRKKDEATLERQLATIKTLANTITWQIMNMDSTKVKALMKGGMGTGFLKDKNIDSAINAVKHFEGIGTLFIQISDLTSCIGIGDLLIHDPTIPKTAFVELKEGAVNEKIKKIISHAEDKEIEDLAKKLSEGITLDSHHLKLLKKKPFYEAFSLFVKEYGESGLKQLKRFQKQMQTSKNATDYMKDGIGIDQFSGNMKSLIELSSDTQTFIEEVNKAIESVSGKKGNVILIASECIQIGIKHLTGELNENFHNEFRHYLATKHGKAVHDFVSANLNDSVFFPTHLPIFYLFPIQNSLKIIAQEIEVIVYLNSECLYKTLKQSGLNPEWFSQGQLDKAYPNSSKGYQIPKFPKGYLIYGNGITRGPFMSGLLYRLFFELQTCPSLIAQMIEAESAVKKKHGETDQ